MAPVAASEPASARTNWGMITGRLCSLQAGCVGACI
jgi:hypothetical protein